ncbi:hypothetical protein GF312_16640 [Candidatus Poribacteria bacterium]|nr:hypothetical protein [Candidatus Poribacteria bacterium]
MQGAGGTAGGIRSFLLGLGMTIGGGFLFMRHVRVGSHFGLGRHFGRGWGYFNSQGLILLPLIIGIGVLFFNSKSIIGWLLTGGGAIIIFLGIISSIRFHFQNTSLFELMIMLVLLVGGIGLMLRSLKAAKNLA